MEKQVEVKYKEIHKINGKIEVTDYCVSGVMKKEGKYNFLSFKEPKIEYIDGLVRDILYDENGAQVVRRSENKLVYSIMYFNTHDKSVGFYDMPSQPIHSSDFRADLRRYDYTDTCIKIDFDLYVDGYFIGSYDTTILIGEVNNGNS